MKIQWESLRTFLKLLCVTLWCQCLFKKDFSLCLSVLSNGICSCPCYFQHQCFIVAVVFLYSCVICLKKSRGQGWLNVWAYPRLMWKHLCLWRLFCTPGSSCWGTKPAFWVMSWVWVSRKLTLGWRLVCRKLVRECFGGHYLWKGGKGSSFG